VGKVYEISGLRNSGGEIRIGSRPTKNKSYPRREGNVPEGGSNTQKGRRNCLRKYAISMGDVRLAKKILIMHLYPTPRKYSGGGGGKKLPLVVPNERTNCLEEGEGSARLSTNEQ